MNRATERTETGYQCGDLHVTGLPRRLSQVLLLRASGNSIRKCAELMNCSDANIKQAVTELFFKLKADSTPELITTAIRDGYLQFRSFVFASCMCLLAAIQADDNNINARVARTTRTQSARTHRNHSNRKLFFSTDEIC